MIKVFHHKSLTDEERDRLNKSEHGWTSEPRFKRYADITTGLADSETVLAALIRGEYSFVATVDVDEKEEAFRLTNHIECNWQSNDEVVAQSGDHRSTSVGDIVEDTKTGEVFIVASIGFRRLTLQVTK